jgi:hypothetical protein
MRPQADDPVIQLAATTDGSESGKRVLVIVMLNVSLSQSQSINTVKDPQSSGGALR